MTVGTIKISIAAKSPLSHVVSGFGDGVTVRSHTVRAPTLEHDGVVVAIGGSEGAAAIREGCTLESCTVESIRVYRLRQLL